MGLSRFPFSFSSLFVRHSDPDHLDVHVGVLDQIEDRARRSVSSTTVFRRCLSIFRAYPCLDLDSLNVRNGPAHSGSAAYVNGEVGVEIDSVVFELHFARRPAECDGLAAAERGEHIGQRGRTAVGSAMGRRSLKVQCPASPKSTTVASVPSFDTGSVILLMLGLVKSAMSMKLVMFLHRTCLSCGAADTASPVAHRAKDCIPGSDRVTASQHFTQTITETALPV